MIIKNKSLTIFIGEKKLGFFGKMIGLMGKKEEKAKPLLFEYKTDAISKIHSMYVQVSFLAVWLDKDNNILEIKRVHPFMKNIKPSVKFRKLLEIPETRNYVDQINLIVESMKWIEGGNKDE